MDKNLILIIGGFLLFLLATFFLITGNTDKYKVNLNYTAVFLQNGQVYFGIVEKEEQNSIEISDIFYLQLQNSGNNISPDNQDLSKFNLVKRGKELHEPKDRMKINKTYVLLTEELQSDSKLLQKIIEYKQNLNK